MLSTVLILLSMVAISDAQRPFNVTTAIAYHSHGYFTPDPVVTIEVCICNPSPRESGQYHVRGHFEIGKLETHPHTSSRRNLTQLDAAGIGYVTS